MRCRQSKGATLDPWPLARSLLLVDRAFRARGPETVTSSKREQGAFEAERERAQGLEKSVSEVGGKEERSVRGEV
eukprot:297493-Rhodomonas_salina.2